MNKFTAVVVLARQAYGWTLEEIAWKLGVSLHTVRAWLKPGASSAREAPEWAEAALRALVTGKPVSMRKGALLVTYAPATAGGRP